MAEPEDVVQLQQVMRALAAEGDLFTAKLNRIESFCNAHLAAASIIYDPASTSPSPRTSDPDSAAGYALRILDRLHMLRRNLERGDARHAADIAFDLGALITEANMKRRADRGFTDERGRMNKSNNLSPRNAEIRKSYAEMIASGLNRKAALDDLATAHDLDSRHIERIIAAAGVK